VDDGAARWVGDEFDRLNRLADSGRSDLVANELDRIAIHNKSFSSLSYT
jgi:hypothetical protein